jgi:hypothetical protein
MYYAETRADNSGYTNHRVTCLVVMTLVESVDPVLLTKEDNSIQHFI